MIKMQTIKVNGKTKQLNVVVPDANKKISIEIGAAGWVTVTSEYLGVKVETTTYSFSASTNIYKDGKLVKSEEVKKREE